MFMSNSYKQPTTLQSNPVLFPPPDQAGFRAKPSSPLLQLSNVNLVGLPVSDAAVSAGTFAKTQVMSDKSYHHVTLQGEYVMCQLVRNHNANTIKMRNA